MSVLASTGEDGVTIGLNASNLSADIGTDDADLIVATAAFSDGQEIVINQEHILIGTVSGAGPQTLSGCTRGYNGSARAQHLASSNVYKHNGTELLTKTFSGSEYFSLALVSGEADFKVSFMWSGTKRFSRITLDNPYVFYPHVRFKPSAGAVLKILVWSWSLSANFFAEMSS